MSAFKRDTFQGFQCCFCGDGVTEQEVGQLIYGKGIRKSSDWPSQALFCHPPCLKKALHASVPFEVEVRRK